MATALLKRRSLLVWIVRCEFVMKWSWCHYKPTIDENDVSLFRVILHSQLIHKVFL